MASDVVPLAHGTAYVLTRRCPGKTTANEDAAAVLPIGTNSAVLVVADGVGGGAVGEQASRTAIETLVEILGDIHQQDGSVRTGILDGIEAANQRVQQVNARSGTTLALVEVSPEGARPYHVGDSMIVLIGGRGKVKLQTVSHSPVGYGVEAGLIDEQEAMFHEDRHLISNQVGSSTMRIEIGPWLRLAPRDTLLIATDGLFDNLHLEEILQHMRRGRPEDIAVALADAAQSRMISPQADFPSKPDDLTLILYRPPIAGRTRHVPIAAPE